MDAEANIIVLGLFKQHLKETINTASIELCESTAKKYLLLLAKPLKFKLTKSMFTSGKVPNLKNKFNRREMELVLYAVESCFIC